jgi:hypothetical protein
LFLKDYFFQRFFSTIGTPYALHIAKARIINNISDEKQSHTKRSEATIMARENKKENRHKAPKFKDAYDEDLDWEDTVELRNKGKKPGKKDKRKTRADNKW